MHPKTDARDNNFNILRMVAASAVLVSHAYPISLGIGATEPLSLPLSMSLGTLAVFSFFIISGFFISQSFENRSSLLAFSVARVLRIYPGLLVVLLFTVLVIGPLFTDLTVRQYFTENQTISYVPRNLSLKWLQYELPGVFEQNPYPAAINGSLWTLVYEVACYSLVVVIGVLGLTGRPWKLYVVLAVYAVIYFATDLLVPLHTYMTRHLTFEYFHELSYPFVFGMLFYHFRRSLLPKLTLLTCAAGGISLACLWTPFFREAFVLFLGLLIFYVGHLPVQWLRTYNRVGDYSYGMYIYAFPCEQVAVALWPGISTVALIALSFPITLALAIFSWHFIERPALGHRATVASWFQRSLAPANKEQAKESASSADA